MPKVKDSQQVINVSPTVEEELGYLPRPCIMGDYNLQAFCGLDSNSSVNIVNYTVFASESIYQSVLPGMLPSHPCGTSALSA